VKRLLIESKTIENDEVEIYRFSKYRITTIIPTERNPVMNVYLFNQKELEDFLRKYGKYSEFLVSVEQVEAIA
jgi:hypothetical protein